MVGNVHSPAKHDFFDRTLIFTTIHYPPSQASAVQPAGLRGFFTDGSQPTKMDVSRSIRGDGLTSRNRETPLGISMDKQPRRLQKWWDLERRWSPQKRSNFWLNFRFICHFGLVMIICTDYQYPPIFVLGAQRLWEVDMKQETMIQETDVWASQDVVFPQQTLDSSKD